MSIESLPTDETQNQFSNFYKNGTRSHLFYLILLLIIVIVICVDLFLVGGVRTLYSPHILDEHGLSKDKHFVCPLKGENWIVVTSIFYPTPAIHKFLSLTTPWNLIVIADRKTPKDWLSHLTINSARVVFLSIDEQKTLGYRILDYLPEGSYARKNIGYLVAITCGARVIFESDDDNLLDTNDIPVLPKVVQPKHVPWIAFHRQRSPFVNIYGSFGHPQIWPRGFPVDELTNVTEDGWHSVRRNEENETHAYIQQFLADLDPDVDALYRLGHPRSIGQIRFDRDQAPIALQPFTFSPYNTQNTVTHYEAFWGLYLPVTTTFRVCDIWRGFWVQRLLWDIGGRLVFGSATVAQVRNSHSYIKDMDEEYQLYHQSGSFVRFLASWSSSLPSLVERIAQLAKDVAQAKFWQSNEIDIINAWLADLHSVNYSFPSIVSPSSSRVITQKRAAVCVTGLLECVREGWAPTDVNIRKHLSGDIDTFLFLSTSRVEGPVPLATRLKQARAHRSSTVTVLYEERTIDPRIPSNCSTFFQPFMPQSMLIPYYQQLWGLTECFDLVKDYEQKMGIRYELFIRSRSDSLLVKLPSTLEPNNKSTIVIPDEDHFGGYNDRFAVGPMALMEKYMRRWHDISACYIRNLHAENFLKLTLDRLNIAVQLEKNLSFSQLPHGVGQCH